MSGAVLQTFRKDPDARIDFGIDWSAYLDDGEIITASTWVVPAGITNDGDAHDTTTTRVFLINGDAGSSYTLTNRVNTSGGRIDDRSIVIVCSER